MMAGWQQMSFCVISLGVGLPVMASACASPVCYPLQDGDDEDRRAMEVGTDGWTGTR